MAVAVTQLHQGACMAQGGPAFLRGRLPAADVKSLRGRSGAGVDLSRGSQHRTAKQGSTECNQCERP